VAVIQPFKAAPVLYLFVEVFKVASVVAVTQYVSCCYVLFSILVEAISHAESAFHYLLPVLIV
jgi:hypothetical protein